MWRLPDNPGSYIIDRRRRSIDLANLEVVPVVSVARCVVSGGLTIWVGEFERAASVPKSFSVDGQEFRRLLDRFHLPAVPDTDLSVALFDLCAEEYERLVDVAMNVSNIHNLLRVALAARQGEAGPVRILDFGCGTGLAVVALQSFVPGPDGAIQLIGTDRSPHMLRMAARRGLLVLTEEAWACVPAGAYDAVIASYVVHLGLSQSDSELISKKLAPGGVFVANYHRGDETDMAGVAALLSRAGLRPMPLPTCDVGTPGNPTILFGHPRI
jgi:SAM-dependent methyltransferase